MSAAALTLKGAAMPNWPAFSRAAPVLFVAMAAAGAVLHPAGDFDLGWHLRAGQLILATHQLPRVDYFSNTMAGQSWVDNEWLWESGLAALTAAGGVLAPIIAIAVLVAVTIMLVYAILSVRL